MRFLAKSVVMKRQSHVVFGSPRRPEKLCDKRRYRYLYVLYDGVGSMEEVDCALVLYVLLLYQVIVVLRMRGWPCWVRDPGSWHRWRSFGPGRRRRKAGTLG